MNELYRLTTPTLTFTLPSSLLTLTLTLPQPLSPRLSHPHLPLRNILPGDFVKVQLWSSLDSWIT